MARNSSMGRSLLPWGRCVPPCLAAGRSGRVARGRMLSGAAPASGSTTWRRKVAAARAAASSARSIHPSTCSRTSPILRIWMRWLRPRSGSTRASATAPAICPGFPSPAAWKGPGPGGSRRPISIARPFAPGGSRTVASASPTPPAAPICSTPTTTVPRRPSAPSAARPGRAASLARRPAIRAPVHRRVLARCGPDPDTGQAFHIPMERGGGGRREAAEDRRGDGRSVTSRRVPSSAASGALRGLLEWNGAARP